MVLPDLTDEVAWPSEELEQLGTAVQAEQRRRDFLSRAAGEIDAITRKYSMVIGRSENESWTQPQGAHDAYALGWHVTHNGKEWESLTPSNVWEPGVSGWREVVVEGPGGDPPAPADWIQPTGAHDAYNTGDRVTFEGQVYESVIDANTWSPAAYPAGWQLITP